MGLIRAFLFENLGLKLVAILLAVAVYLHVYTDRPATMVISFPIEVTGLADSLSYSGRIPGSIEAELRGTGKQLIRLRLTEPRLKVSLAGIGPGHFQQRVVMDDLPVATTDKLRIERLIGAGVIDIELERKVTRQVPVAARLEGSPQGGMVWSGEVLTDPATVMVQGPRSSVAMLDSVRLHPVQFDSRGDTLRAIAMVDTLPDWCSADPPSVTVIVPLERPAS